MGRVSSKAGIALPLVLLLTAVLSLTLFAVITSLGGLRRETARVKHAAEFQRAAMTAEARFEFLAITEPFGSDGLYVEGVRDQGGGRFAGYALPELATTGVVLGIAGQPYRWLEAEGGQEYRVAIQDEAGLVNIYQADVAMLTRLFLEVGLGDTDATNLANELIAYNADSALHQPMRRPSEIYRLDSASDLITEPVWRKLQSLIISYSDSSAVNINTAPAEVLKIWFDLSDDQAQAIVDQRQGDARTPGVNILTSPEQIGVAPVGAQTYAFTGGRLRFIFTDPRTGDAYQSSLVLTPNHIERPIWIENARTRHLQPEPDPDDELQDFPEIPRLAS